MSNCLQAGAKVCCHIPHYSPTCADKGSGEYIDIGELCVHIRSMLLQESGGSLSHYKLNKKSKFGAK